MGARDTVSAAEHLHGYGELLAQHIAKEDDILYPWMDRNLGDREVGQMYSVFAEINSKFGDAPENYRALIERLENDFL